MGMITIMRSRYLQLTNGLFFIKNEQGTYVKTNKDGTIVKGDAANGFRCYLKSVNFNTKQVEVDGYKRTETKWAFELIDDNAECFLMDFRADSSTAFRFLNCLANVEKFGLLELESWQSSVVKNGKTLLFQHINVHCFVTAKDTVKIEPRFPKEEIPEPEPLKDSDGEPIIKDGYQQFSHKKKIKFFIDNVLPIIQGKLKNTTAANDDVKFEVEEFDYVQDDAPVAAPVVAKKAAKEQSVFFDPAEDDGVPF